MKRTTFTILTVFLTLILIGTVFIQKRYGNAAGYNTIATVLSWYKTSAK
jgi:preprotein translocase subunit SecG